MKKEVKPKVLIYCTRLLEAGGIESHIQSFVSELYCDLDIYLLVLDARLNSSQLINYKEKCKETWIINKGGFIERLFFLVIMLIKIRTVKYDYFYSNGQGDSIKMIRKFLKKSANWVHHHHTAVDNHILKEWSPEYLYTLKNANILNACSQSIALKLEELTSRKSHSIPCFSYPIELVGSKIIEKPIQLGFFGRLIPEKGITQLCRISKNLDPSIALIHIWGKGELYDEVFFKNYPNINYHGSFQGKDELYKVLSSIDAFILISEHPEGLPISLLEVMGAGKPWIATDIGGIKDIAIEKKRNYLLPKNLSEDDLISHIEKFVNGLIGTSQVSEDQINFYNSNYAPHKVSKDWLNIFSIK